MHTKNYILNALNKKVNLIVSLSIITLFTTIAFVLTPVFLGNLIDKVISNENPTLWVVLVCSFIPLWLLGEFLKSNQSFKLGNYLTSVLQKEAYNSALKAEINEFNKIPYDEMARRISEDCSFIGEKYIINNVYSFINQVTFLVVMFISLMLVSPILGLISLLGIPVFYLTNLGVKKLYKSRKKEVDSIAFEGSKVVEENFAKIRDIKLKNGVSKETNDYNSWFENNYKKNYYNWILADLNNHLTFNIIVSLITLITVTIGLSLSTQGNFVGITIGKVVTCGIYVPVTYASILKLMQVKIKYSLIEKQVNNLDEIYSLRSEVRSEPINQLEDIFNIKFTNVNYEDSVYGKVQDISFDIKNNEKLGILSIDDSSSNVIYELLTKVSKPRSGSITINNCETGKINTLYLRDLITAVSDTSGLFNDNIINNITYPLPFDEYKYNDSLYKAKLKDVIFDLEYKDNTNVCELPNDVLQQITLANAFYKDSKIFIFNNATSSLDVKVEEEIMKEIYKLKNKIIIIMSDHAYNLMNCDKILITQNGKVVEYGYTQDLINNKDSIYCHSLRKIKLAKAKVS